MFYELVLAYLSARKISGVCIAAVTHLSHPMANRGLALLQEALLCNYYHPCLQQDSSSASERAQQSSPVTRHATTAECTEPMKGMPPENQLEMQINK